MMAEPPAYTSSDHKRNERQHPQDYNGDSIDRNLCLCGGDIDVGSYLRENENKYFFLAYHFLPFFTICFASCSIFTSRIKTFFFFGTCIHFCFLVPLKVCFCKPKYRPNNDQLPVLLLSIENLEIQVYTKDFSIFTGLSLWFCLFQRF